jgi:Mn2+/Fe2+ NRAMP family transporter
MQQFIGALFISVFAAIPAWIAFGPGEREFSSSFSFGGFSGTSHAEASIGRIVFGIGAVAAGLIAVFVWTRWLRSMFSKAGETEKRMP